MVRSSLSRREMLSALLGAPLAASAAGCDRRRALPPGEIVFPVERRGHQFRDGLSMTPTRWETSKVVIVGGGVAGLAAGWRLARAGFLDFTLLEIDDVAGGTAKSGANDVSAFPWGAHYITVPMKENRGLVGLLRELGILDGEDELGEPVVGEQYLCREPQERLFHEGVWSPGLYLQAGATEDDLRQASRFRARMDAYAAMKDAQGRRAFTLPMSRCSTDASLMELHRVSMAAWLTGEGFTSPRLLWTVDYACRDDYGALPDSVSAWAGIFYFAARIALPGSDGQPVITWPEGNGRLVHHLASVVGSRARMRTAAFDVVPAARSEEPMQILALGPEGAVGFRADQAIVATPQLVVKHLIRPYRESAAVRAHLEPFTYGAWLVANLTVRERPRSKGFPFAWDNVLYDSPSLGYVVAGHQRGSDHGPTVLTYYHPMAHDDSRVAREHLLSATRDELADAVLTDLGVAHPDLAALTTRLDVMRWGHAMVKPSLALMTSDARREAARPYRGVHFAHTDLSGVALFEEAFDHGLRAAEEVLAARGVPFQTMR